jgi:hypothetical protein
VRNLEDSGERRRGIFILKSRGMSHSSEIRPFLLTDNGIEIGTLDPAVSRAALEASQRAKQRVRLY